MNREMAMFNDQFRRVLSLISLICSSLIAMAGLACSVFGVYGLFAGLHGGPIVAGLLTAVGAALMFVGYFCGRNSFQLPK
jgi:hypothetical protein